MPGVARRHATRVRRLTGGGALLAAALMLIACGGGRATAPDTGGGPPLTAATAPTGGATGPSTTAGFPATTPAGVLQLASERPTGVARYHVTVHSASGSLSYDLEIASNGQRARLHQTQPTGEVWVGLNVATNAITYSCTADPGGTPSCKVGDPDGVGAQTAEAISRLLGNDVIQSTFGAAAAGAGATVGPDVQADTPVSCMAASGSGGDLRLCATADGHITELTDGGTRALATSVTSAVTTADLDPPVS
jgi:hypothetical protein